jgi:glycosyltransferase involved in cell wall biosynthesis
MKAEHATKRKDGGFAVTGTPLVSVIIPTHNRRMLVLEAIASVRAQRDCPAVEVIVVDDGSTDGTDAAIAEFAGSVRYVWSEQRGVAAARNLGAGMAHGNWLAFLDSDDWWMPRKLAAQLAFHDAHPDVSISQTDEIWIRRGTRVNPRRYHSKPSGDIFLPSLRRCLVSPSAVMMRRDVFLRLGGFDEGLEVCEDYDLWLRVASRMSVGLVGEPLVVKRGGHADQLSRRVWGMDRFRVASLAKLLATLPPDDERRAAVCEVLQEKCGILAQGALRRGRQEEAARYTTLAAAGAQISTLPSVESGLEARHG